MSRIFVIQNNPEIQQAVVDQVELSGEWQAVACDCVHQALDHLHANDFQLVIIDLQLAVAEDGSMLQALIRSDIHRPVLITGRDGQVQQVAEALAAGAAGFVHIAQLQTQLLEYVDRLTAAAHRNKTRSRLLDCMTSSVTTFSIENDPLLLPALLTRLQSSAELFGVANEAQRTRIGIALEEAISNAMYHGNLEVSSELRKDSIEDYYELASQRRMQSPYRDRRVRVIEELTPEYARFTICDEGPGFDTSRLDREPDPSDLEAVSGRGLLLMKSFMDDVRYNAVGNSVTLTKYRSAPKLHLAA